MRLSRDGLPVVIHDATLRRTCLFDGVVAEMTARKLSQVDAGSGFRRAHAGPPPAEPAFERIPLLSDVFELSNSSQAFAQAKLYVELKTNGAESSSAELARAVVRSIRDYQLQKRVVVLSFDLSAIVEVKRTSSSVRTGALFKPVLARSSRFIGKEELITAAVNSGADEVALHHLLAGRRLVRLAQDRNLPVVIWTVNRAKWLAHAEALGIHALITDNPAAMKKAAAVNA